MKKSIVQKESIAFAISFLLIIFCLGFASDYQLIKFYVTGEKKSNVNQWNPELEDKLQSDYNSNFAGKFHFINLNGLVRNVLNQREMNGVVKLNNDYLALPIRKSQETILMDNADVVSALAEKLEEKNIDFLYVQAPPKVTESGEELPTGISDYSNKNIDTFLRRLKENNTEYVDIRECFREDNLNVYDYYFKTDHHWNVRGGFYAYNQIVERLEKNLSISVDKDLLNEGNYKFVNYEDWYLGYYGRRTGYLFDGLDDFEVVYPQFSTFIKDITREKEGTFEEVILNTSTISEKQYESGFLYDVVYGNSLLAQFSNPTAPCKERVVVISDSMGEVVNPFMILTFSDVYSMHWSAISIDEIERYNPDVVIVILIPGNISTDQYFQMWDLGN